MRNFYLTYQKHDASRPELSWTHYRLLLRVQRLKTRQFYTRFLNRILSNELGGWNNANSFANGTACQKRPISG